MAPSLAMLLFSWVGASLGQDAASDHQSALARQKQQAGMCTGDSSDPSWTRFCGWLGDYCNATELDTVSLGDFMWGDVAVRGMGTARDVKKGGFMSCIPKKCWLKNGTATAFIQSLGDEDCNEEHRLSLHMAEERRLGEQSVWYPYLAFLPDEAEYRRYHPAFLPDTALAPNISYWPSWAGLLRTCYDKYKHKCKDEGRDAVDYDPVYTAFVQVTSRIFSVVGMLPMIDQLNTAPDAELNVNLVYSSRHTETERVCLQAKRDLKQGEELTIDYASQASSALVNFATYGFAFAPELHDPGKHRRGTSDEVDACVGLRPADFAEPDPDQHPAMHNLWRYAQVHCSEGEDIAAPQEEL